VSGPVSGPATGTAGRVGKAVGVAAVLVFTLFPVWMMVSTALDGRANANSPGRAYPTGSPAPPTAGSRASACSPRTSAATSPR